MFFIETIYVFKQNNLLCEVKFFPCVNSITYIMRYQDDSTMRVFVGTSGWMYFWNTGGNLKWYIRNTPFNAVELNASFYRFPFRTMVSSWVRNGRKLRWSIKVNRLITHKFKMSEKAVEAFRRFRELFRPMEKEGLIDFYLFQLPPMIRPTEYNVKKIESFVDKVQLGTMFALEFRHIDWFDKKWERWAERLGITFVSVDAPGFESKIFCSSDRLYLRLHGREEWYSHIYTREEIAEILLKIADMENVDAVYIFLNNNHGMLPTGELIIKLIPELLKTDYKREK